MKTSLVRLLCLQTLWELQTRASVVCPDDWVLLDGRCYLFDNKKYNYDTAEARCDAAGGMLLVQETQEEIQHLKAFLDTNYADNQFWIGLKSEDLDRYDFLWVNGAPLVSTDWAFNTPNNRVHVLCVSYVNNGAGYGWNDSPCFRPFGLICELPETERSVRASVNGTVAGTAGLRIEQQVSGVALHTDCLRACIRVLACESLAYNPASRQCRMLSHNMDGNQHQDEEGWKTYNVEL